MSFLCRVAGLSLRDRARSLNIRRENDNWVATPSRRKESAEVIWASNLDASWTLKGFQAHPTGTPGKLRWEESLGQITGLAASATRPRFKRMKMDGWFPNVKTLVWQVSRAFVCLSAWASSVPKSFRFGSAWSRCIAANPSSIWPSAIKSWVGRSECCWLLSMCFSQQQKMVFFFQRKKKGSTFGSSVTSVSPSLVGSPFKHHGMISRIDIRNVFYCSGPQTVSLLSTPPLSSVHPAPFEDKASQIHKHRLSSAGLIVINQFISAPLNL